MSLAAISIDVDSIRHYHSIHGLEPGPPEEADPIYATALPRFWELLDGRPATLFLIGADAPRYAAAFEPASRTGCEIASHSQAHDYRLTRLSKDAMHEDLAAAEAALLPLAGGQKPVGFRAPGYNQSPELLEVLVERGYVYDSSLLPAPAYFGARAVAIGAYSLRGTPSSSLLGRARAFSGPLSPYRTLPHAYWNADEAGTIWELPIGVEPRSRWPLIGTTWVGTPGPLRRSALRALTRRSLPFVFEMHAIDLLDAKDEGVPAELTARQPDLRISVKDKMRRLRELFEALSQDWELTVLADWPDLLKSR
ncbi:MAG: polysaccharide deacetylase family protein [Myxococcota bacterium]